MPEQIRILQMVYNFDIEKGGGGVTRCAIDIAESLDPAQFQVSIFGLGHNGSKNETQRIQSFNEKGIHAFTGAAWVETQPYQCFIRAYQALLNELKLRPVDIVHSHSEFTDIVAVFLKMQRKIPCVLRTTHYGYPIEWRNDPARRAIFTNFLYPLLFDREVGVNPSMKERLDKRWLARLLKKETLFVNEAIQLERFQNVQINKTEKKLSLGIPPEAPLIGCVGRLAEQKGYTYLLQAAAQIIQHKHQTYFIFIGDGPLADELKTQASDLGIREQVVFAGSRTDVEELLACLDLYAMASLWEGMPISILESMASGIPVITTNVPGSRDLIRHGQNGWLVPPADPEALYQAILKLMEDKLLREALAQRALETIPNYSINSVTERYSDLYQSLER